ncbi:MAG: site-specific tyrosine recombinase XerD [Phycisphaera sp.]|nr:site-specific tyrosine recombinase XerD [Phycisphaera sp.]
MANLFSQPVRDFLAYLRVECGLSANTLASYELDLKRLVASLEARGVTDPASLNTEHLIQHLRDLRSDGMASSSVARHLATFRAFGRFLVFYRYAAKDPAELLERPATWRRLPRTMHSKQIDRLLEAPQPTDPLYLRDRAMVEMMYATGCRASEVGAMDLADFHDDLGVVKITGKGNKQRIVPIGKPAIAAVQDYLRDQRPALVNAEKPCGALFLTQRGTAVDRFVVWHVIKRLARRAGLKDVHPHTVRHTFATHLLGGGADLRVVQELLGHTHVTTTQIYTHVDQGRLKAVINQFHPRG